MYRVSFTGTLRLVGKGESVDDRILEIVFFLMDRMRENSGMLASVNDLSEDLRDLGYSEDEISVAFTWLADRVRSSGGAVFADFPHLPQSHRIFTPQERLHLTGEAQSLIVSMANIGLVDTEQLEMILDRAQVYGTRPVGADQIKWLTSRVLTNDLPGGDYETVGAVDLTLSPQLN